jgi:hypothetical protein
MHVYGIQTIPGNISIDFEFAEGVVQAKVSSDTEGDIPLCVAMVILKEMPETYEGFDASPVDGEANLLTRAANMFNDKLSENDDVSNLRFQLNNTTQSVAELWESAAKLTQGRVADNLRGQYPLELRCTQIETLEALVYNLKASHRAIKRR